MSISEKDVLRVAHLARIRVAPDELEHYQEGLSGILSLVARMHECDTDGVEPMAHPQDIQLRLREDEVTEPDQRTAMQESAPLVEAGLYLVPRVIE
ncbi:MAG: Asp-tRNA(Asn)/Glu-tRNA(Gln) amidotransferase GatCAB subunit C [Acidiferrobacteraceae bacterium]|nr:Asp-tRNA(Asn)/Glu-tRNA(Gln) amidotransferase GatCAB subunit C [Acidiferrobacteraceae bacterium]MDP6919835.1 Asp-tRNA(Asn)/Glu-tRNA(Gln) amidotransferase subunit GatC [Arenicellales bacterium]